MQANLAAKNHAVILPDAEKDSTLNQLVAAAFGAAGQRCMALSMAVFVGSAKDWCVCVLCVVSILFPDLPLVAGFPTWLPRQRH